MHARVLVPEVVDHLEHAGVVVDADDLLEQRGVAAREVDRLVDEILDGLLVAAGRQQIPHHGGGLIVAERRQAR